MKKTYGLLDLEKEEEILAKYLKIFDFLLVECFSNDIIIILRLLCLVVKIKLKFPLIFLIYLFIGIIYTIVYQRSFDED